MEYIRGITFAAFAHRGILSQKEARRSLDRLAERTGANFIIFAPAAVQEHAQSEKIDFTSERTMSDEELTDMIGYARQKGLRVALKPTVNCKNGTWRAHINFFDEDVPCEPKWGNWFRSYTEFQLHFAGIAQKTGCEMFLPGCEMVQSERREEEWRRLIADIRGVYGGMVSYNTDKYQEHNVKWWDAVDVISSSGYYPTGDWERQLDRIEKVVRKFQKPFFFAECGCMSTAGAGAAPNDWSVQGDVSLGEQADWYAAMFRAASARDWVKGFALWDWRANLYPLERAAYDRGYDIYGKPAEQVVAAYYRGDPRIQCPADFRAGEHPPAGH